MSAPLQMKLEIERKPVEKVTRTTTKPANILWLVKDPYHLLDTIKLQPGGITAKTETDEITFHAIQNSLSLYSSGRSWTFFGRGSGNVPSYQRADFCKVVPIESARLLFANLVGEIKAQLYQQFPAKTVEAFDIVCEIQEAEIEEETVTEEKVDVFFELDAPFPAKEQSCAVFDEKANVDLVLNQPVAHPNAYHIILKGYGWASDVSCTSAKLAKLTDEQITALYENLAKEIIKLPPVTPEEPKASKPAPAKPHIYDITTQTKFSLTPLVKTSDKA